MKTLVLPILSLVLTVSVLGNAYALKKQYYPAVVYIMKSNPSMIVMYIQTYFIVVGIGKPLLKLLFGELRPAEREHIAERSWYGVIESGLAFAVFRNDFTPKFVALLTLLLFLKVFHWLLEERIDLMERSPIISLKFHVRILTLFVLLGALDIMFISIAYQSMLNKSMPSQTVFGFEYAILLITAINLIIKYVLCVVEIHRQVPWEHKVMFLLYINLVLTTVKVALYGSFIIIMTYLFTVPIYTFRPIFYSVRDLQKLFADIVMSRRAIRNMNTLPDATAEDLSAFDNVCIICREEIDMRTSSKKLACNHIFHTRCLRSWFQRQQTCPTCRLDVLQLSVASQQNVRQQQPRVADQQPNQQQSHLHRSGQMQNTSAAENHATQDPSTAGALGNNDIGIPPQFYQIFMNPLLRSILPPSYYEGLSEEELRRLERQESEGVDAMIQYLESARAFVDSALVMLQQYQAATLVHQETQTSQDDFNNLTFDQATESTSDIPRPSNESAQFSGEGAMKSDNFEELVRQRRLEILNKKNNPSSTQQ